MNKGYFGKDLDVGDVIYESSFYGKFGEIKSINQEIASFIDENNFIRTAHCNTCIKVGKELKLKHKLSSYNLLRRMIDVKKRGLLNELFQSIAE